MVARLAWAKNNPTEVLSTTFVMSYPHDSVLSEFGVAPQPQSRSEIQELARDDTAGEIQTAET